MNIKTITPQMLHRMIEKGQAVDVIDVRTAKEFRDAHAVPAVSMPLDALDPATIQASHDGAMDKPLYVICWSGGRASKACEQLAAAGFTNVCNVEGGTQAWKAAGLPIIEGKKTISLERQLHIVIGTLVLVGAILGYFVHPLFLLMAALPGAGLIMAGLTGLCPMAMLLGRMQWNASRSKNSCCDIKQAS